MQGNLDENQPLPTPRKKLKTWQRWTIGVVFVLMCVFGLGMLWVRFYLDPYLKTWLCRQVEKGSAGKYKLDIKHLNLSIWRMSLEVKEAYFYSTKLRETEGLNLAIKAKQLHIRQVDWWKYWNTQQIVIESLELDAPEIEAYNPKVRASLKLQDVPAQIQKFVADFAKSLQIKKITLLRSKCSITANTPTGKVFHQFSHLDLRLQNLLFETKGKASLEDFSLLVRDYQFITPDKFYSLRCRILEVSKRDSMVVLRQVRFAPAQNSPEKDRITIQLPYLRIAGIDFWQAIVQQNVKVRTIDLKQADFHLHTKIAPIALPDKASAPIPFPQDLHTWVQNFPIPIAVDTFSVIRAGFYFKQYVAHPQQVGYHFAKEVNLTLTQVRLGQGQNIHQEAEQEFHVESGKPLFAKTFSITVHDFQHQPTSGLYQFGVKRLHLSSQDSLLQLDKVTLTPLLSAEKIAQEIPYQSIISEAHVPLVVARKINFEKIIYQQIFRLGSLHLYAPQYEGFLDATKPKQAEQKFRNFEHMLRTIPLDIQADTLAVHHAKVGYTSLHTTKTGVGKSKHAIEKLNFKVLKIDLGRALHESAIEHIDTKQLQLEAQNYSYQNAEETYLLSVEKASVMASKRLISVQNLRLLPTNNNVRQGKIRLHIPQLKGEGVDFVSFMLKQQMDWDKLLVEGANVEIMATALEKKRDKATKKFVLQNALQTMQAYIRVDTLQLKEATFMLQEFDKQGNIQTKHTIEKVEVQLLDITLGEATRYDLDSLPTFWQEESLDFALKKYLYEAQGLTYRFSLQNIQKKAYTHQWNIETLSWASNLSLEHYRQQFPERKWLVHGTLHSIRLDIPNLEEIIFHRNLVIQKAVIQEPVLSFWVFEGKKKGEKTDWREFQQEVPLAFSIDTLSIQNAKVSIEMPQRWEQQASLELDVAKLAWHEKLEWQQIKLRGTDYSFVQTHSTLKVATWELDLEPEPHFRAGKMLFTWKSPQDLPNSYLQVEQASAHLEIVEIGKPLKLNHLRLQKGKGELYLTSQQPTINQQPTIINQPITTNNYQLSLDSLSAQEIDLKIHQKTLKETLTHSFVLEKGNLQDLEWKIQQHSLPETEQFSFKIRDYETYFKQSLYHLKAKSLLWENKPNNLIIQQLSVLPTVTEKYLSRLQTHQKEHLQTTIKEVRAKEIDVLQLIQHQTLYAQRLTLDSVWLHLSADRRLPTIFRRKRMPAEQLKSIKLPLRLDTLDLQNTQLIYKEKVKGAQQEAELFVQDIHAQLLGVRTRPQPKDSLRLTVKGKIMGVADTRARIAISLSEELGAKAEGKVGELKADFMNKFLEVTRHIQIRKGKVQEGSFWINMRDSLAIGELEAGYKRLRLEILSAKKDNKKRGFITFLANIFINNRNNLKRKNHKIGEILYNRQPEETFTRFLIKALATGILNLLK
jgi:hypothetical protein